MTNLARREDIRIRAMTVTRAAFALQNRVQADSLKRRLALALLHFAEVESVFLGDAAERSLVGEAQWLDAAERFLQVGVRMYTEVRDAVAQCGQEALIPRA
jgi:hypothetical protein